MNCRDEFLEHIGQRTVKCAMIGHESNQTFETKWIYLQCNYDKAQCDRFLRAIDFEYDSGFGIQEVHGVIWYTDGTYSDRYEYDGSEEWVHRKFPPIPEILK